MCMTFYGRRNKKNCNEVEDIEPFRWTCLPDFQQNTPYLQEAYLPAHNEFSRVCIAHWHLRIKGYNFRVLAETLICPEGAQNCSWRRTVFAVQTGNLEKTPPTSISLKRSESNSFNHFYHYIKDPKGASLHHPIIHNKRESPPSSREEEGLLSKLRRRPPWRLLRC